MIEDQGAFAAVTAARKRPDADPDRDACFSAALLASIRIPQAVAATSVAVLELVDRVADKVNPWLLSDLAVCGDLAMATTRCALHNVRANLPDVNDPADRDSIERSSRALLARGLTLIQRAAPRIWARHARECGG
jgi:formiminotetrahydrofolate cyclodeaminase